MIWTLKSKSKTFFLLSFTISLICFFHIASADIIIPTPVHIWPETHILLLFLTVDILFNFFVAAGFFSLFGKNILAERISTYFIAILIITLSGIVINFVVGPIFGYGFYITNFIRRVILSVGQIILFPFIFSWFKLSDKKTALKVGVATVVLGFIIGSVIALFYLGAPVTPIGIV